MQVEQVERRSAFERKIRECGQFKGRDAHWVCMRESNISIACQIAARYPTTHYSEFSSPRAECLLKRTLDSINSYFNPELAKLDTDDWKALLKVYCEVYEYTASTDVTEQTLFDLICLYGDNWEEKALELNREASRGADEYFDRRIRRSVLSGVLSGLVSWGLYTKGSSASVAFGVWMVASFMYSATHAVVRYDV